MDEDRTSRRSNAAAAVAGVAAIVVVATPMALFTNGDGRPGPGPGIDTPVAPHDELVLPSHTSPNRIDIRVAEIHYRFPLAAGWPDERDASPGELGREGPARTIDSLQFAVCSTSFDDPGYADRLRADWSDVEDQRKRQLTSYAEDDEAVDAVRSLADFFRACPAEDFDDGLTRVAEVIRTAVGDESWAMVRHFERGGAPVLGLEIIHLVRVGRAVLIDTMANEGRGGPAPEGEIQRRLDAMSSAIAVPVWAMCMFAKEGCAEGEGWPPSPRRRRS